MTNTTPLPASNPIPPDYISPVHVAVLKNDVQGLRHLLATQEYGVDCRTGNDLNGSTPLMLACLFGRTGIFIYLVQKKASLQKRDCQGLSVPDYLKSQLTQDILKKCQAVSNIPPSKSGRKSIDAVFKTVFQMAKHYVGRNRVSAAPASRTVFLRNRRVWEICNVEPIAATEFNIDLDRKSTGAIRGKNQKNITAIAISGWQGDKAKGVICNATYSERVRHICAIYGFHLATNWLDHKFTGPPSERAGSFSSCHSEKQLATFIVYKAMDHLYILENKISKVTVADISQVKKRLSELPENIRQTVIELDHKPCQNCLEYLRLLSNKTGLEIECCAREWFTVGERRRLRQLDRSREPNTSDPEDLDISSPEDLDVSDHEDLDVSDTEAGDENGIEDTPTATTRPSQQDSSKRSRSRRLPTEPYQKRGSPIFFFPFIGNNNDSSDNSSYDESFITPASSRESSSQPSVSCSVTSNRDTSVQDHKDQAGQIEKDGQNFKPMSFDIVINSVTRSDDAHDGQTVSRSNDDEQAISEPFPGAGFFSQFYNQEGQN